MTNEPSGSIRRNGAYVVKAAESRPSRVVASKSDGRSRTPSSEDKKLARALLKSKRG